MGASPQAGEIRIGRRSVRIVPSPAGLLFGAALFAMFVGALNYQLTLGYALTFLIASVAIIGMFHTVRNIALLDLRSGRLEPVFAGQLAEFTMIARNATGLERYALSLHAPGVAQPQHFDVAAGAEQFVAIALPTRERGWMQAPALTIATTFPIGIWHAWVRWQPARRLLVYPAPETPAVPLPPQVIAGGTGAVRAGGQGDLAALRPYADGDTLQRIAWKVVARTACEDLITLQFDGGETGEIELDWSALPSSMDDEARVSRLTRWTLDADAAGVRYALRLPGVAVEPGAGAAHRAHCLELLATWSR